MSDQPRQEKPVPPVVEGAQAITVGKALGAARSIPLVKVTTRVTIIISMMYLIMYLDRVNISMAAKAIMNEFSLSNTQLGFAFSAFFWPYFIGQLFGGYFAKHIGARLTLILCGTLVAISTLCTGFIMGIITLFIVRFALGCGEGPAWSGATSAMSDWYNVKKFGFIQGVTHSASRVGMTIAPPIVATIMFYLGWRYAFIFCGILSVAWVIAWASLYRDNPRTHPLITEKELQELPPVSKVHRKIRVPTLALARRIAPVSMCQFTYGVGLWLFVSWLPLYFMNKHHLNLKASALLSALTFGAGLIGDALGGVFSDWIFKRTAQKRLARNALISSFLVLAAVCLYITTMITHNLTAVTIMIGVSFFFLELTVGPMWAVPMDITRDFAGIAAGMMNFGAGLAGIVSPPVIGLILDRTGNWDNAFMCIIATLAVGGILGIFLRPDRPFVWSHDGSIT